MFAIGVSKEIKKKKKVVGQKQYLKNNSTEVSKYKIPSNRFNINTANSKGVLQPLC